MTETNTVRNVSKTEGLQKANFKTILDSLQKGEGEHLQSSQASDNDRNKIQGVTKAGIALVNAEDRMNEMNRRKGDVIETVTEMLETEITIGPVTVRTVQITIHIGIDRGQQKDHEDRFSADFGT